MLYTILIGFIAGLIARALTPGQGPQGFIVTTVLGIAGAWVGSLLLGGQVGLVGSVVGAVIVLVVIRAIKKS